MILGANKTIKDIANIMKLKEIMIPYRGNTIVLKDGAYEK